ncbi:MAG: alpha/beta hydrolase [Actinobacteria bacterium]|nr:alpha/beta hydrolase [Actinomycetota bacterium]
MDSLRIRSSHGVELALYDFGGSGPPLLMAHATGFHGRVWLPLAEQLRDHFHLFSLDFRAHGASTSPDDRNFGWAGVADDVLATVDAFGLEQPFGLGHSMGGAGLLLAEQARPGTFRALYVFEPIVFPVPEGVEPPPADANPLSAGALRRREVFASRAEARNNYASKAPLDCLDPEVLTAYVEHGFVDQPDGAVRLACRREDEAECYRMGGVHGGFDRLGEVTCPVTVASGALTNAINPTFAHIQADAMPNGRVQVFDLLGHFGPLEDPTAVAKAVIAAFLGG